MMSFFKKITTGMIIAIGLLNHISADIYEFDGYQKDYKSFGPYSGWCDRISLYGSWLYWKVNGDEFDYAVHKGRVGTDGEGTPALVRDNETIHDLKFDWDSGFKLGLGFEFPCLSWGVDVVWTHYDSSASKSKEFDGTVGTDTSGLQTFVSLPAVYNFGTDLEEGQVAEFSGRTNFRYNVIDIEFNEWCSCCTNCVAFRPHVGLRIAEIHEGFHDKVLFGGGGLETFSGTGAREARFFAKNRFKGIGVRAGLDLELCLCEGWSFIGRSAASIIWGRTHLDQNFKYTTEDTVNFYDGEISEHYRNSRVITDLSLGLLYRGCACSCYPYTIELAWEHHYIFGQHRFWVDNSFFSSLPPGDNPPLLTTSSWKKKGSLALQGLTLTLGLEF